MRVPIYLVVKGTGQFDESGTEYVLLVDVKLTHACAEYVCKQEEGCRVIKMVADKRVDMPTNFPKG